MDLAMWLNFSIANYTDLILVIEHFMVIGEYQFRHIDVNNVATRLGNVEIGIITRD